MRVKSLYKFSGILGIVVDIDPQTTIIAFYDSYIWCSSSWLAADFIYSLFCVSLIYIVYKIRDFGETFLILLNFRSSIFFEMWIWPLSSFSQTALHIWLHLQKKVYTLFVCASKDWFYFQFYGSVLYYLRLFNIHQGWDLSSNVSLCFLMLCKYYIFIFIFGYFQSISTSIYV